MLIGMDAMVEERAGPQRCEYMKSRTKIFYLLPLPDI